MGFLDKVKEQASDLKAKVGDTVSDAEAKHRATELLEELGRLTYAERTARGGSTTTADIDRVISEISALESDGTAVLAPPPPSPPAVDTPPPPPPPG